MAARREPDEQRRGRKESEELWDYGDTDVSSNDDDEVELRKQIEKQVETRKEADKKEEKEKLQSRGLPYAKSLGEMSLEYYGYGAICEASNYEAMSEEDQINFEADLKQGRFDSRNLRETPVSTDLAPIEFTDSIEMEKEILNEYWNDGLDAISRGEVCVIVLAGGQTTFLGYPQPKGTLPLEIQTAYGDSLLGIQAAKIELLQSMARQRDPQMSGEIHLAVMTSPATNAPVKSHLMKLASFHRMDFDEQITIFCDETDSVDENGHFLFGSESSNVSAHKANGGLMSAITPHLPRIKQKGIKFFHVFCVDNVLCKVADPHFIGFAIRNNADVAAKCVSQLENETDFTICLDRHKTRVVRSVEFPDDFLNKKIDGEKRMFHLRYIDNHLFTMKFLSRICNPPAYIPYCLAYPKMVEEPCFEEKGEPAIMERKFIYDIFEMSRRFKLWKVERNEEFSRLKHYDGSDVECLSTCQKDLANLNKMWLTRVGAKVTADDFYLKTLTSYNGENLDELCHREVSKESLEAAQVLSKFFL